MILRDYFENKSKVSTSQNQIQNTKTTGSKTSELISEFKIEKEMEFEEMYIKEEVNGDDPSNASLNIQSNNKAVELSMHEIEAINENYKIDTKSTNKIFDSSITTTEVNINETIKINDNKDINCTKCNLLKCKCNKSKATYKKRQKKTHNCSICNEHFLTVK